jgi:hypothetical protein
MGIQVFYLCVEGKECHCAVCRGQGVDDIASQCCYVADLRPANAAAGLCQERRFVANQGGGSDLGMGHCRADDNVTILLRDVVQTGNARDVDHGPPGALTAPGLQDQVGAAGNDLRFVAMLCQFGQGISDR